MVLLNQVAVIMDAPAVQVFLVTLLHILPAVGAMLHILLLTVVKVLIKETQTTVETVVLVVAVQAHLVAAAAVVTLVVEQAILHNLAET